MTRLAMVEMTEIIFMEKCSVSSFIGIFVSLASLMNLGPDLCVASCCLLKNGWLTTVLLAWSPRAYNGSWSCTKKGILGKYCFTI